MSLQPKPEPSNFTKVFECALEEYERHTGEPWTKHPLAEQLEQAYSLKHVEDVLLGQAQALTQPRESESKIVKWLKSAVPILYELSTNTTLRNFITVPFPFTKPILIAFSYLLGAAKGVIASHDALVNLLELIGESVGRLEIYTTVALHGAMVNFVVEMMVQVLHVLGLVTEEMKRNLPTKILREILRKNVAVSLEKLKELRRREVPWTAALTLMHTNIIRKGVEEMHKLLQQVASDNNQSKRDKVAEHIRNCFSPPDPWENQDEISILRHPGTAAWFLNGETYSKWKWSEQSSLLWIHGIPGAGKSVLCSAIIQDIQDMQVSWPAILTFFYFDGRVEKKRNLRGLLSSLLVQLCDQSDPYCDLLSEFFSDRKRRSQHASLKECLKKVLEHPRTYPVYLIVDALDECPNPPVMSPPREQVLQLLEELVDSIPNLHICVTSRTETDIKLVLDRSTPYPVVLQNEGQHIDDINRYISSFVNNDKRIKKQAWLPEDKKRVIDNLVRMSAGMFQWVGCQLPSLRDCPPCNIQRVLDNLPKTLNETYERVLGVIKETIHWELAHQLFQCIAVASRPLTVGELAEVCAFEFDAQPVPKYNESWRRTDSTYAVLSLCSSLLSTVNVKDTQVIQFSHPSVKEFLTSGYLSQTKNDTISCFNISMTPAHTLVARVCLGMLLHLPNDVTGDDLKKFPLAGYAAEYWADHAQFEDVSQEVEDGMKQLFNPSKSHLEVWTWICDRTEPYWNWRSQTERAKTRSKPRKTALHYAAFYGLLRIVECLIAEHSQDEEARGFGDKCTALYVASTRGHIEVARVLLSAVTTVKVGDGGHAELTQVLLNHGPVATAQNENGWTPLHFASDRGYVELARVLLDHGASLMARNENGWTPLHLASDRGHLELARLLLERGADATAQNENDGWTPLHFASDRRHLELARVLFKYGAVATAKDWKGQTPMSLASERGDLELARVLLEYGALATAQDWKDQTPMSLASDSDRGRLELARVLLEHGADPMAQNENGSTPLHFASDRGQLELVRALLEYGAVATAQDGKGQTPMSLAWSKGHTELVQVLREHSAVATAQETD